MVVLPELTIAGSRRQPTIFNGHQASSASILSPIFYEICWLREIVEEENSIFCLDLEEEKPRKWKRKAQRSLWFRRLGTEIQLGNGLVFCPKSLTGRRHLAHKWCGCRCLWSLHGCNFNTSPWVGPFWKGALAMGIIVLQLFDPKLH